MIRAFIFDFDGLILDTESSIIEAYSDVHAAHGVPFNKESFLRSVGHADYAFDPWHAFEKRADRAALEIQRRKRNRERDHLLALLPGVASLLETAREAGLHVGLASNSGHAHVEGHLARLGLLPRFEFLACREDSKSPKPEPDLYRLVVNHFGIHGHEAVAFEDSRTGVVAARRAGLWVVAAPNPSTVHHDFSQAHWIVPSLAAVSLPELKARFEKGPGSLKSAEK